jgi:hypothetical protein
MSRRQIDQTTDPDALGALAQALKALHAKLTDAQTSQALDPVLRQIGLTTDPQALLALAEALQALPAKLTNDQASRALDRVLGQIGQTTDPDALQLLAPALQALAAKMTDAAASQALDPRDQADQPDDESVCSPSPHAGEPSAAGEADRRRRARRLTPCSGRSAKRPTLWRSPSMCRRSRRWRLS